MLQKKGNNRTIGTLVVLLAALLFSSQVVFGKLLLEYGLYGLDMSLLQYLWGLIIISCIITFSGKWETVRRESRGNLARLCAMGAFSALCTVCLFVALETVNAGIASMLLFTNPVYICLFFMITGIKKVGRWNKAALVIAFAGSLLVLNVFGTSAEEISYVGIGFGLVSGIGYAAYCIFYDLKVSGFDLMTTNFFLQLTAFLIVSVLDMDFYPSILSLPVEALIMTMVMALFCGVAPLFFLFWGMRTIGSEKAGIIGVSELPFTLVVAFLVLGETMDGLQLIGIFLVVLAVLVLQKDM